MHKHRSPGRGREGGAPRPARVSIGTPFRRLDSPAARRRGLSKILISNHLTLLFREGPAGRDKENGLLACPSHPTALLGERE